MSKAPLVVATWLLVGLGVAAAEELPVRDPMRPFGGTGGGTVTQRVVAGPRFELTAVLISSARRVAIVNGRPYQQGEFVDGAEIVSIEPSVVRLREQSTEHVISLGRPAKGRQPIVQGETVP